MKKNIYLQQGKGQYFTHIHTHEKRRRDFLDTNQIFFRVPGGGRRLHKCN